MRASRKDGMIKGVRDEEQSKIAVKPKVKADYRERGLDACHFCGL